LWKAYCHFHIGEYQKAIDIYDEILKRDNDNKVIYLYKALCLYAICKYKDAKKEALKGPEKPLQIRLLYHIS
jgi:intraflagellar transport protein 56